MATQTLEKVEVRNRWTGRVQFTAEISATPDMLPSVKLGLAVRWGRDNDANLSGADLSGANLSDAYLRDAYLSGANLSGADLSGANLSDAYLRDAYLSGADLSGADLSGADLRDAYLSGADLSGANLSDAYLRDAYLSGAYLSGANLSDVPKIENIHQKVYAAASAPGALDMGDWHTCETTHCRAGWVTALAGEDARDLEARIGTAAAATLIYLASDPTIEKFPSFYCSNEAALADMKAMAEVEAARSVEA